MKKLLLTTLLLCAGLAATAYEYQFNWNQLSDQLAAQTQSAGGTLAELPTTGINILIHPTQVPYEIEQAGDVEPNLHVWNNDGFTTVFPGVKPSGIYEVAVEGDESNKKIFYYYHFDAPHDNLHLEASFGSTSYSGNRYNQKWYVTNSSTEREMNTPGTYFFDYNPYGPLVLQEQYSSFSTDETTFYVRVMGGATNVPTMYYQYDWNSQQHEMAPVTIDGEQWYKYTLKTSDAVHGWVIVSDHGNNQTQTTNIPCLKSGTYYLDWYPNGDHDRYNNFRYEFCGMDDHYVAWSEGEMSNEVSFTTTNEHGSATLTIVCQHPDDIHKIQIVNGELKFPRHSTIRVSVDDGSNLRQIWLGTPNQGNKTYQFGDLHQCTDEKGYDYTIDDLVGLWDGHIYKINNGLDEFETPEVSNWEETYFLSDHVKVYSEGTLLEQLLYADSNVRLQYHKVDDPLVGVAVRNVQGADYLIARTYNQLSDAYRQKPAEDQTPLRDKNGNLFAWSDPNMPQYGWVALKVENPGQYVGKKFDNVRGTYCQYVSYGMEAWIPWMNPNIVVTSELNILGDESTTLNTYSLANLVQPKDSHIFLIKPNLYELCNIHDVMRSHGDHFLYVPDHSAIMSEVLTQDASGNDVYVSRNNVYVENGLDYGQDYSYASLLQWKNEDEQYSEEQKAYVENDIEILGEGNLGLNWQLYDKVYDFNGALIVAAEHAAKDGYVYPLAVPVREHMETNGITGGKEGLVLHIIGKGALQEYKTDMLVGSSDYWSRYKYSEDRNAYRNDVVFSFSKPGKNDVLGEMDLNRYDNKGNKTAIARIVHTQDVSGTSVTNNFTVTSLAASREALDDAVFTTINTDRTPNYYDNKKIVMGYDQTTIPVTDMFYSTDMESRDHNNNISNLFTYKLEPAEGNTHEITTAVSEIPVYKTDVNVAGHSMYTKSEVDGDTDDHLQDDGKVKVYFTPNHATAVTRYDVLGGMDEGFGYAATKSSTDLVNIDATNFMDNGIEIANAEQYKEYVPAVYTLYNDNTYGCYKEEVGNATVTMTPSELYESTEHSGKTGEYIYFCNLNLSTVLTLVENDERYLLRVWRQVGDEPKVLLNGLEEFTHDYFNMGSKSLKIDGFTTEQLYTHYGELNNWATKEAGSEQDVASKGRMVPDMFKHTDIDESTDVTYTVKLYVQDNKVVDAAQGVAPAGAPRRAQDNPQAYYVKRVEQSVRVSGVITGVDGIHSDAAVSSVRYVNVAGQVSDKPWSGVNMVVTTLADGTTRTSKIVR